MIEMTKELHDLVYLNTVWPQELLENLSDPDYLSVNFNSYLQGVCAEVVFIDEGKKVITNYYFNSKNHLQRVEMIEDVHVTTIYSRIDEIVKVLTRMNKLDDLHEVIDLMNAA